MRQKSTSVRGPWRLPLHIYTARSAGLALLDRIRWLRFEGGGGVELRRQGLELGNRLRLGQWGLELSWRLGGRRLKSSPRVYWFLAALSGPERPSEARQKQVERVLINRSKWYLRAGRRERVVQRCKNMWTLKECGRERKRSSKREKGRKKIKSQWV